MVARGFCSMVSPMGATRCRVAFRASSSKAMSGVIVRARRCAALHSRRMRTIRPRSKRHALRLAIVVIALGGLAVVARAALTPTRVSGVVSIATQASYQDAALLGEAFSLPVARTYSSLVSQPNGSVCGPTSVANVQRSLGVRDATASSVLEGSGLCPFGFCFAGLTLEELASLARAKTGKRARIERDA